MDTILLSKDRYLKSLNQVVKGSLTTVLPCYFNGNKYILKLYEKKAGYTGYNSLLNKKITNHIEIHGSNDIELTPILKNFDDIQKLDLENSLAVFQDLLNEVSVFATCYLEISKLYQIMHKLNCILLLVMHYIDKKYQLSCLDDKHQKRAQDIWEYFEKNNQLSLIFPLKKEIFSSNLNFIRERKEGYTVLPLFMKHFQDNLMPVLSNNLLSKDIIFRTYYIENMINESDRLVRWVDLYSITLAEELNLALGDKGLFFQVENLLLRMPQNQDLAKYIASSTNTILTLVKKYILPKINLFSQEFATDLQQMISDVNIDISSSSQDISISALDGSLQAILNYGNIDSEMEIEFREVYNKWINAGAVLSSDADNVALRKKITSLYWKIYARCFAAHKKDKKPLIKPVELMFRFGFLSETLLNESYINLLISNLKKSPYKGKLQIYDAYEWLSEIFDSKIIPSYNIMGEMYRNSLKEELKNLQKKDISTTLEELDTPVKRIEFEIMNLISEGSKMCNTQHQLYFPILSNSLIEFAGGAEQLVFLNKDNIQKQVTEILKIDFSAFYREIKYQEGKMEEFVQSEVLPYVILMPVVGQKSGYWQVKGKAKNTPGRMLISRVLAEPLNKVILYSFGYYRWEIVRELLGPLWNDLSQLSLTAEYMDYITSYKKNKDLTPETKSKISEAFKKVRNDRERFINDYMKWIEMESQGRKGVNKVIRNMFYRQIPFAKEIREVLAQNVIFQSPDEKYQNISRKTVRELAIKYKKYTKNGAELPKALQQNIDFYQR